MTTQKITVRSKSELMIAELYTTLGIPFKYEARVELPDGNIIYPDFTIYSEARGRWLYHEHAGMITDPYYRKRHYKKAEIFAAAELYPQHDVLFTYDNPDGTINLQQIRSAIIQFVM